MPTTDDDQIEVLSSNLDNGDAVVTQVLPDESSTFLKCLKKKERERKLVSRAVVIISGVLFLLSVILVGVSLMMSRNIDDLGKWYFLIDFFMVLFNHGYFAYFLICV